MKLKVMVAAPFAAVMVVLSLYQFRSICAGVPVSVGAAVPETASALVMVMPLNAVVVTRASILCPSMVMMFR